MSPHLIIILVLSCCSLIIVLISALHRQEEKLLAELEIERKVNTSDARLSTTQIDELIELIERYRFFQDENLKHFEQALRQNNLSSAEKLIQEKFSAQEKPQAQELAETTFQKLLNSVM